MIECRTLGPAQVTVDDGPAPPELLWRKHLALLIYLARSPRRTRSRDHLTGLLWSEKAEAAARHSLNEALRVIRRAAGEGALETKGEQIVLAADAVTLDVDRFEALTEAGDVATASRMMLGEFLEGFTIPDATGFEDWLSAERMQWSGRGVAVLSAWSAALADEGKVEDAVNAAERAVLLDPVAEAGCAAVLKALTLGGHRNAALERFDRYAVLVRERLGTEPTATLVKLAERIRSERGLQPRTAERAATTASRRTPLIGRERELARLLEVWGAARTGEGAQVAVVRGDQGAGKTRLCEELVRRARLDGAAVTAVRAVAADREVPEHGLLALAGGGLLDAPGVAAAPAPALAALAAHLAPWQERFPHATAADPMPAGRAVVEILRVVAEEGPVVVWVDDAEWLDPQALAELAALPRDLAGARLLLLLGVGQGPESPALEELRARLGREVAGVSLSLGPFDGAALRQLVSWALPAYSATDAERLARRLAMDSAGVPLLVVELLDAVAAGLELRGTGTAWPAPFHTLDQTLPGDLPDTVTAAIRVSFRRLSGEAQKVLAVASVLGDRVTVAALVKGSELDRATVETALDELEWTRWMVSEARGYGFVARITREVVARDMVTPGMRRRVVSRES